MKFYYVYDINGNILKHGSCSDTSVNMQAGLGEFVAETETELTKENVLVNGVPTYVPVAPTVEETQWRQELLLSGTTTRRIIQVFYYIDKRLRVLESTPLITLNEFKQEVKTLLGL